MYLDGRGAEEEGCGVLVVEFSCLLFHASLFILFSDRCIYSLCKGLGYGREGDGVDGVEWKIAYRMDMDMNVNVNVRWGSSVKKFVHFLRLDVSNCILRTSSIRKDTF